MKNVFRYKTSSICFFVGMAFSFIALYYGNRSEFKLRNAMMEKNGNKYQYETDVSYYGTSFSPDWISKSDRGNCIIRAFYVSLDYAKVITSADIIVYNNEALHLPMLSGKLPQASTKDTNEHIVAIGEAYRQYVHKLNGEDYFTINGEEYRVTGYIGGGMSNEYDEYIVLHAECLGDGLNQQLCSDSSALGMDIVFQSDKYEMAEDIEKTRTALSKMGSCSVNSSEYNEEATVNLDSGSTYFWIYVYCGGISVLISVFWIIQRKKELVIRRAYGYSNKRLIGFLAAEYIKISAVSLAAAAIIILAVNKISDNYMNRTSDEIVLFIVTTIIYLIVATVTAMLYPIFHILNSMPDADINKKDT